MELSSLLYGVLGLCCMVVLQQEHLNLLQGSRAGLTPIMIMPRIIGGYSTISSHMQACQSASD